MQWQLLVGRLEVSHPALELGEITAPAPADFGAVFLATSIKGLELSIVPKQRRLLPGSSLVDDVVKRWDEDLFARAERRIH
eukprot:11893761-Karenia_brevis.AAC.1